MTKYTVIDTLTKQEFPAKEWADVEQAVEFILSGEELTEWEQGKLNEFFFEAGEYGASYSNALGLEVVSHV